MDLPFLHEYKEMIILFIESFNPCSYGSSVLTDFKSLKLGDIITIVSILVLMDLPFLHDSLQELAGAHYNGFNPCSYGSSVLTQLCYSNIISGNIKVSILVLMDLPFLQDITK